ncbi:sporulation protein [Streptomyces millisiae]|uniref:Sporulation protein n=1 Tax=Streptomyces millisiae TaxID=3075542 RepID=A0ABU2LPA8_9ACTN|nr:sporulation protein [Streptomyces sp. DSM 44918]MDT0318898.1 sporulation protein [Streptomyces sp. DSM 44918]
MVFKRLLGAIGVGGPSVDTILDGGAVVPGSTLTGRVMVRGGSMDVEITGIHLDFVARVEAEGHDSETDGQVAFHRVTVGGGFRLAEEQEFSVPFQVPVPWETPITEIYGQPLGIVLGVRTELAVAEAVDKGDLDPLLVRPLPVAEAVLEAFGQLGFGFKSADLELGRIGGTGQTLPFYQEIEMYPPERYAHAMREVEISLLASPGGLEVVLEADKPGGFLSSGHDVINRFFVSHQDVGQTDFNALVDSWVQQLAQRHGGHGGGFFGGGHGHHEHHEEERSGFGAGAMVAGVAAGVVGGLVMGEIIDEIGDAFEGDEE